MCGDVCDMVDLRLSLARCMRRTVLFLRARMPLLTVFDKTMLRGFWVAVVNGTLVGKRLEAIRSPSVRSSCMVSALSSICVRKGSLVVLSDGGSVWAGVSSMARSLARSIFTRAAVDSVSPRTSSAH